jgi:DinB family
MVLMESPGDFSMLDSNRPYCDRVRQCHNAPMDATWLDNYRLLARYNRWFNTRLYDACERVSDEERKRDRGAFFGSIHDTLNHLVWGDRLWLARFAAQ